MKTPRITQKICAREYATKYFGIPAHKIEQYFDSYFLIYWEGKYFLERTRTSEGLIDNVPRLTKGSIQYIIIYHNITRGEILSAPQNQVALSFREPKPELGIPAYVLVGRSEKKS